MAKPWKIINRMRSKIRHVLNPSTEIFVERDTGRKYKLDDKLLSEDFYTWDYDTQQIVTNRRLDGWHFIFDLDGNLIKSHKD